MSSLVFDNCRVAELTALAGGAGPCPAPGTGFSVSSRCEAAQCGRPGGIALPELGEGSVGDPAGQDPQPCLPWLCPARARRGRGQRILISCALKQDTALMSGKWQKKAGFGPFEGKARWLWRFPLPG